MQSPYLSQAIVESAVGLVLTEFDGRANAMTISCFSEVAHHPTSLWIAVAPGCLTHEFLEKAGRFTLVVLHKGQADLARFCGSVSGREHDKCKRLRLHRGPGGFLCLDGALSAVACRVRSSQSCGDHRLFIADILAGEFDTRTQVRRHLLTTDLLQS